MRTLMQANQPHCANPAELAGAADGGDLIIVTVTGRYIR
jgi:hypothetical protein